MPSILEIVDAAYIDGSKAGIRSIVGNSDRAKLARRKANNTAQLLAYAYPFQRTIREATIPLVQGQTEAPLPADWLYPLDRTFWEKNIYWKVAEATLPSVFSFWRSANINPVSTISRIREDKIEYIGTGRDTEIILQYVTSHLAMSADGTSKPEFDNDTDLSVIDPVLLQYAIAVDISEAEEGAGQRPYLVQKYQTRFSQLAHHEGGSPVISMGQGMPNFPLDSQTPFPFQIRDGDIN